MSVGRMTSERRFTREPLLPSAPFSALTRTSGTGARCGSGAFALVIDLSEGVVGGRVRPVLRRDVERRRDREEDAAGEEERGLLARGAGGGADRLEDREELLADRPAQRRVAGRRVGLKLAQHVIAVGDELEVGGAHRAHAFLGILATGL